MFSKGSGGLEQSFLDYNCMLCYEGLTVLPVVHPKAAVIKNMHIPFEKIRNISQYDLFAVLKIKRVIEAFNPSIIIVHGNRAIKLVAKSTSNIPIVAVAHNDKVKFVSKVDGIIAVSPHLVHSLQYVGYKSDIIHVMPNAIHLPDQLEHKNCDFSKQMNIGVLARLEKIKGVETFVKSCAILKNKGIPFKAIIGGHGTDLENIESLIKTLDLTNEISLLGWVYDKDQFFKSIDILCVPSKKEAFGISILEGMMRSKLIVATPTGGAKNIIENGQYGILSKSTKPEDLADSLIHSYQNVEQADKLTKEALTHVQKFSIHSVAIKLRILLEEIKHHYCSRIL
jgi:glycosyltransferase involved in cell wall biosynthesis